MNTITLPRSVVEQALAAFSFAYNVCKSDWVMDEKIDPAMKLLEAALEQPDMGNPVSAPEGWKLVPVKPTAEMLNAWCEAENKASMHLHQSDVMRAGYQAMLAAAPQPPALEQPQVEQEPVAYATQDEEGAPAMLFFDRREALSFCDDGEEPTPLYTHPQPKREPLTDKQIRAMWSQFAPIVGGTLDFARAVERAHGIGDET